MAQSEQKPTSEDRPRQEQATAPFWEKFVGAVGLVLVLMILGFLTVQALGPKDPPDIAVEAGEIGRLGQGFLVQMRATNRGDLAAAEVVIHVTLHAADAQPGDPPVESRDVTFDFVPAGSSRSGGVVFTHDPAEHLLDFQVQSFIDP